jgi:hypothetical protein
MMAQLELLVLLLHCYSPAAVCTFSARARPPPRLLGALRYGSGDFLFSLSPSPYLYLNRLCALCVCATLCLVFLLKMPKEHDWGDMRNAREG